MQSLIQIGIRASSLLTRRRSRARTLRTYTGVRRAAGMTAAESAKSADEQLRIFNDLLQTVCRKLFLKIRELDCVSGELNNLMKVCAIPAIFVDEQLVVRSFTRESRRVYRLSQQDIGRSLLGVVCGLDYYSLGDDFRRAAETRKTVNRYLERRGCDVRYFMRIVPNFCRNNSFVGAVLIFNQLDGRDWGTA